MDTGKKGVFIAFEGIDGSGKSTQIQLLARRLEERKVPFYQTMEPTDSWIGTMIQQILTGKSRADHRVLAALFTADRLEHLLGDGNGVCRKIEEGTAVLMDRYYFSSYAYQSVDLPMEWLIQANAQSSAVLRPTVSLFLDVDPALAMERIVKNRSHTELFEKQARLVQVRQKYMEAFERLKDEEHVEIIDGNRTQEEVAGSVWDAVKGFF